jgi:hypothetical protein
MAVSAAQLATVGQREAGSGGVSAAPSEASKVLLGETGSAFPTQQGVATPKGKQAANVDTYGSNISFAVGNAEAATGAPPTAPVPLSAKTTGSFYKF